MSPDPLSFLKPLRLGVFASVVFISAAIAQTGERLPGAKASPESSKAAAERPRREEWCKANPEKCREMEAKIKEREAQCKADPEKCRAEMQARSAERFKLADTNKDGKLSREEAEKGMPAVARRFDQIDANKDGMVTLPELEAARKARGEQRKAKSG